MDSLWFGCLLVLSTLLHEFGHSAACTRYRARQGGIGIGLYFIFPVAFSDVSGAWMLTKRQRMVVNLAGLYMEMMLVLVLLLLLLLMPSPTGVPGAAVASIAVRALFIILPLMRNDGYWMLSDMLSMPDLLKVSNAVLLEAIHKPASLLQRGGHLAPRKRIALLVFAVANLLYPPAFIFWAIGNYAERMRLLPAKLAGMMADWVAGRPLLHAIVIEDIVALVFYLSLATLTMRAARALWRQISRAGPEAA